MFAIVDDMIELTSEMRCDNLGRVSLGKSKFGYLSLKIDFAFLW